MTRCQYTRSTTIYVWVHDIAVYPMNLHPYITSSYCVICRVVVSVPAVSRLLDTEGKGMCVTRAIQHGCQF